MRRKGVEEEIIEEVLSKFYSDEEELETALSLAKKKIPNFPRLKSRKEIVKLKNYLFSRGFTWETIEKVIENLGV